MSRQFYFTCWVRKFNYCVMIVSIAYVIGPIAYVIGPIAYMIGLTSYQFQVIFLCYMKMETNESLV